MEKNARQGGNGRTWQKLLVLAALGLGFGLGGFVAQARDTGDENVVEVNVFECEACGLRFWTFAPDDLVIPEREYDGSDWLKFQQLNTSRIREFLSNNESRCHKEYKGGQVGRA